MSGFCKAWPFPCTQYLVGAPSAWIRAWVQRGVEPTTLWPSLGVMEAQIALIAAFRSSASLGLRPLAPLLITPLTSFHISNVCRPIKQSSTVAIEPASGTVGSLAGGQSPAESSFFMKPGALKCPAWQLCWLKTFRKHSGPTPAGPRDQSQGPVPGTSPFDRFHLWEIQQAYWVIFASKEAKQAPSGAISQRAELLTQGWSLKKPLRLELST